MKQESADPGDPADLQVAAERTAYRERLDVFLASREVAETLTYDALRKGVRLHAVVSLAADVARYADTALAIVGEEYRPHLDCHETCCFCCCKPGVFASIPEFLRLLEHVRTTFSVEALEALLDRTNAYVSQLSGHSATEPFDELVPCPLLVDSRCSAYEVRPLVCRGFNSTNVEACRAASTDPTVTVPIFAIVKDVTDGATVGVAQSLQARGVNAALVDLGTALHIALRAGDEFPPSIVDGAPALAPAENRSLIPDLWAAVCRTARQIGINPAHSARDE